MADEKDISKDNKSDVDLEGGLSSARKAPAEPHANKLSRTMAVLAAVVTVAAWCVFFFDGTTAMVMAVVGAVASVLGLRCGHGCLRDVAITALIAAVVLIVVFGVFAWILPYFIAKI